MSIWFGRFLTADGLESIQMMPPRERWQLGDTVVRPVRMCPQFGDILADPLQLRVYRVVEIEPSGMPRLEETF